MRYFQCAKPAQERASRQRALTDTEDEVGPVRWILAKEKAEGSGSGSAALPVRLRHRQLVQVGEKGQDGFMKITASRLQNQGKKGAGCPAVARSGQEQSMCPLLLVAVRSKKAPAGTAIRSPACRTGHD